VVTDKLMSTINAEAKAKDRGHAKAIERAAKMYAIFRGMGYRGVHIGGHGLQYEEVEEIIDRGIEVAPNWRDLLPEFDFPQPGGWYYFERDPESGLNTDVPVDRSMDRPPSSLGYRIFRGMHANLFDTKGPLFKPMRALCAKVDGSRFEDAFDRLEHIGKVITNDCMHCGDCGLVDVAYICPTSQCPKHQRNGPCGGSYQGWCEVYPEKRQCIYVRAYPRLKHYGEEDSLGAYQVPPINHDLWRTSSWLNYYLGRDHTAKRLGIKPPEKKAKSDAK
jgi:methylenetetrahydrofolate reductase (NADPH)